MNPKYELLTPPETYPVTAAEFEAAIRQATGESNVTNTFSIAAATVVVESYLGFRLIRQKWKITFDTQPAHFEFPPLRITEISAVVTIAADGAETTEDSAIYTTEIGRNAAVWLNTGEKWTESERLHRKFRIEFWQGYTNAAAIPNYLREAVKAAVIKIATAHYLGECDTYDCMYEKAKTMLSGFKEWCI
jgi:uncharacterized phiE125 gp8 family phage protein